MEIKEITEYVLSLKEDAGNKFIDHKVTFKDSVYQYIGYDFYAFWPNKRNPSKDYYYTFESVSAERKIENFLESMVKNSLALFEVDDTNKIVFWKDIVLSSLKVTKHMRPIEPKDIVQYDNN